MAKKKAKKARKKKTKRGISLLQKIQNITARVPRIEPTGEVVDEQTGEVLFHYTKAQEVFEIYRRECEAEGIRWRPYCAVGIQPLVAPFARGIAALIPFCIEDIKTGERIIGWGFGIGANADWSGNTAHTRALKQFLLTTFEATWEDPEQLSHQEQKELLRQEVVKELVDDGTMATIEQVKYWATNIGKKGDKKDGTSTRKPNTGKRTSHRHKKD